MPRFFVEQDRVFEDHISIVGEDAHHIARSLRMAVGEQITVCDREGKEYLCAISSFDEDREVVATIISSTMSENEPRIYIRLFQALPKGDKLLFPSGNKPEFINSSFLQLPCKFHTYSA